MDFLLDYIDALVGLGLALVVGLFFMGRRIAELFQLRAMATSTYVVFDAYPIHLDNLVSDMKQGGWRFVSSTATTKHSRHYRFEKSYSSAQKLGDMIYKDGMPLTANRLVGADLLVKIADHGKL